MRLNVKRQRYRHKSCVSFNYSEQLLPGIGFYPNMGLALSCMHLQQDKQYKPDLPIDLLKQHWNGWSIERLCLYPIESVSSITFFYRLRSCCCWKHNETVPFTPKKDDKKKMMIKKKTKRRRACVKGENTLLEQSDFDNLAVFVFSADLDDTVLDFNICTAFWTITANKNLQGDYRKIQVLLHILQMFSLCSSPDGCVGLIQRINFDSAGLHTRSSSYFRTHLPKKLVR